MRRGGVIVAILSGHVMAVADDLDELVGRLHMVGADPRQALCLEVGPDYGQVQEILGLRSCPEYCGSYRLAVGQTNRIVGASGQAQAPIARPTASASSSSLGNSPVLSFEYSFLPPTVTSKQPPPEGIMTKRLMARLNRGRIFAVKLTA
jgi:hypothetical protein